MIVLLQKPSLSYLIRKLIFLSALYDSVQDKNLPQTGCIKNLDILVF